MLRVAQRGQRRGLLGRVGALARKREHADSEYRHEFSDQAHVTGQVVPGDHQLAATGRQREPLRPAVDRSGQRLQRGAAEHGGPPAVRLGEHERAARGRRAHRGHAHRLRRQRGDGSVLGDHPDPGHRTRHLPQVVRRRLADRHQADRRVEPLGQGLVDRARQHHPLDAEVAEHEPGVAGVRTLRRAQGGHLPVKRRSRGRRGGQLRLPEGRVALPDERVSERSASRAQHERPVLAAGGRRRGHEGRKQRGGDAADRAADTIGHPVDGDEHRRGRGRGERGASEELPRPADGAGPAGSRLREPLRRGCRGDQQAERSDRHGHAGPAFRRRPAPGGGDGNPAYRYRGDQADDRDAPSGHGHLAAPVREQRGGHGEPEPDGDPERRQPWSAGTEQEQRGRTEGRRSESWRLDARLGQERRGGGEQVQRPRKQNQEGRDHHDGGVEPVV